MEHHISLPHHRTTESWTASPHRIRSHDRRDTGAHDRPAASNNVTGSHTAGNESMRESQAFDKYVDSLDHINQNHEAASDSEYHQMMNSHLSIKGSGCLYTKFSGSSIRFDSSTAPDTKPASEHVEDELSMREHRRKRDRVKKWLKTRGPRLLATTATITMFVFNIVSLCG